jgi:hypothetical protein
VKPAAGISGDIVVGVHESEQSKEIFAVVLTVGVWRGELQQLVDGKWVFRGGVGGEGIKDGGDFSSVVRVGVVGWEARAVVGQLPWICGVDELTFNVTADAGWSCDGLFESESGDDMVDVIGEAVDL